MPLLINKLAAWGRTLVLTGGAQAAIQLIGFGSGLFVIRHLSAAQYAYYTIANAVLGMMTVLTDSGINNGVLAQAGLVWQNRAKFGAVLATGLKLRRQLASLIVLLAVPMMLGLLRHQGADWITAALIAGSILPVFFSTISSQLLETVPRLSQRLLALQRIQLGSNLARLIALVLVVPRWPLAAVASIVTAVPQWIANWRLRRLAHRDADWASGGNHEVRRMLWRQVKRTMPGAVYYSLSGQINIWLISIFGRSGSVAAVGALSRLAMLLTVFTAVFGVVALPRFARLPSNQLALVVRRFWQLLAGIGAACLLPIALLVAFPEAALAVIGPQYQGLDAEVILMAVSSLTAIMSSAAYSLAAARGIVASPMIAVPVFVAMQAGLIAALPIHTVSGVIEVSLFSSIGQGVFQCGYFWWHMHRSKPTIMSLSSLP